MLYDVNQTSPEVIEQEVSPVIPNTFGVVVQNLCQADFVSKRLESEIKFSELVARGGTKDKRDL